MLRESSWADDADFKARTPSTSMPHLHRGWAHPMPHLRRDWARPVHICTETGLAPVTSAPGQGSPLLHLERGKARPLPHLRWDWARSLPHIRREFADDADTWRAT